MTANSQTPGGQQWDAMATASIGDEQAVLGSLMQAAAPNHPLIPAIREILRPADPKRGAGEHHFHRPSHRLVFQTIVELNDDGRPCDPLGVMGALKPADLQRLGGVPYLHTCLEAGNVGTAPHFARRLANATLLRQLAENAAKTTQLVLESPLDKAAEAYERAKAHLDAIAVPQISDGPVDWETLGPETLDEMERLAKLAEDPNADPSEFCTPWPDLDDLLCPLSPGSLVIIAGRPGMAKSTVARNIARHMSMAKKLPTVLFSLEMSRTEIGLAMMAEGARLRSNDIKHGTLSDDDWVRAARWVGETQKAPFVVDDSAQISVNHVDRYLSSYVRQHDRAPAAVIVDYLQLFDDRGAATRQEAVSLMSRGLKLLAKKYGTVVVMLSQLNRGPEQRTDKRPLMSDLRESGSLEQDADVIILLHRDDYYNKESTRVGEIDFDVAKHRGGPTGTIVLAAQLHMSRIVSMAIPGSGE